MVLKERDRLDASLVSAKSSKVLKTCNIMVMSLLPQPATLENPSINWSVHYIRFMMLMNH